MEVGWPDPAPATAELRSRVGEQMFEAEWARGRGMTVLEAIDFAIEEVGQPDSPRGARN